jgi:hypothetical protein
MFPNVPIEQITLDDIEENEDDEEVEIDIPNILINNKLFL